MTTNYSKDKEERLEIRLSPIMKKQLKEKAQKKKLSLSKFIRTTLSNILKQEE